MNMADEDERDASVANDPYCQYSNLPLLLKRFSFQAKMSIATYYSSRYIHFDRKKIDGPLPWCLETFVMLAMEAREYTDGTFDGKNRNKFIKMCDAIWSSSGLALQESCTDFTFIDNFVPVTALNQFHMQENQQIKQYRFWQVFNDDTEPVCLKSIFEQKMGTTYEDFVLLGRILQLILYVKSENNNLIISQDTLRYLVNNRFAAAAKQLCITRAEYVEMQKRFAEGSQSPYKYVYSLSPSYQYVFVNDGANVYFPLPHLINQSITSSLLYRITENNNSLRDLIGKNIWEKYVLNLVSKAGVYQEVYPEQEYKYSGSKSHSPDVLARQNDNVLFIDSKSTVPNLGIRLLDQESFDKHIGQVAENIVKLYKQMQKFEYYNPFKGEVSKNRQHHWGIAMVLEDAYIRRIHYFEKACHALKIEKDSAEWNWLVEHIKVIGLYEIERVCLCGKSLIEACSRFCGSDSFNLTFMDFPVDSMKITCESYLHFQKDIDEKVIQSVTEMHAAGAI